MKLFFTCCLICYIHIAFAQTKRILITMPSLKCQGTNDGDFGTEDEIYMLLMWKADNGTTGQVRIPSTHYSMSMLYRKKLNSDIDLGTLFQFDLNKGSSMTIYCLLMEQDDGTFESAAQVASELFRKSTSPLTTADQMRSFFTLTLQRINNTYGFKNSDDWMGGFQLFVRNDPGGLVTVTTPFFNLVGSQGQAIDPPVTNSTKPSFNLAGDGGSYNLSLAYKATDFFSRPRL